MPLTRMKFSTRPRRLKTSICSPAIPALIEALLREGGGAALQELDALGEKLGRAETYALARLANIHTPELQQFDRAGRRIDEVLFHPAWHELMAILVGAGAHAAPWASPGPGAQVARAAAYLLVGQVENGTQCPVTMTYASVPALRQALDLPQIARAGCRKSSRANTIPAPCPWNRSAAPWSAWA